jgi:hypothetical protein
MPSVRDARRSLSTTQERFESTPVGEVAISVLIALVLIVAVSWSMPDSAIRRKAVSIVEPVALISGLDQAWYMFAPDPFRRLETVVIEFETANGERRTWDFPLGGVATQFTWYRWHKLKEQAVRTPEIRAGIVRYAGGQVLVASDYPAQATMVLTAEDFPPPGTTAEPSPPFTEVLYTETLTGPP